MDKFRNLFPFHRRGEQEEEQRAHYFRLNGGLLIADLITTFGHRYNIPIRNFTLQQLIRATNNFSEKVYEDFRREWGTFYRGNLDGRPILVKYSLFDDDWNIPFVIHDIAVTSQMSHHKNVLPLIGCCLESRIPAMVYDNALDHEFVGELLNPSSNNGDSKLMPWRNRIKIAKDVSKVLIYLHTAFSTPIIFRDMNVKRVVIDRGGVAKLFGFALSISLPPGELRIGDMVVGSEGYVDPEYWVSDFVTEKSDVYSMGALMHALFAQSYPTIDVFIKDNETRILVRYWIENNPFKKFTNPEILEGDRQNGRQILQHLLALSTLALRCTKQRGENRPELIDVTKQLSQIEKCACS